MTSFGIRLKILNGADHSFQNCIYEDELDMVGKALGINI